jgi:hypothetical protein
VNALAVEALSAMLLNQTLSEQELFGLQTLLPEFRRV